MHRTFLLTLGLLVLGGLAFFWLRTSAARGGTPAPEPQESATPTPPVALAPVALESSATRELGDAGSQATAEQPSAVPEVRAEASRVSGTIHGSLRGSDGRSLDGVHVRVVDARGVARNAETGFERYAVHGLAAGHYWITADARGHRTARAEVELMARSEERLDFALEEVVSLDVLVLGPDRRPPGLAPGSMVGVLIAVARQSLVEGQDRELAGSAENHHGVGRFRPSVARASEGGIGVLELDGEPPVWVHLCLGQKVLAARRVGLGEREVAFVLEQEPTHELGTLRIRALAANGTPLPIQHAMVRSDSGAQLVNGRGQERVEVTDLVPGDYTLTVTAQDHAFQTRKVAVRGGLQDVDVEVELSMRAQGRVLDAAGAPLGATERDEGDGPSVHLGRIAPGNATVSWDERMSYFVDEEGRFSLSLAPGVYVLRAKFEGALSSSLRVDLSQGPVEGLELVLAQSVELILQREQGEWRGARYELRDEEGLTACAGSFAGPEPLVLRAARGRYELLVELDGRRVHEATLVLEREPVTHRLGW